MREQIRPACSLRPSEVFAAVALRGDDSSAILISSGAAFVACALQGVAGDWRGGVPLKTRGVIFERASVFSVFRGRCGAARPRVRRVRAVVRVDRVGVKNAAAAA